MGIDEVGIDKVGIDKVGIDKVGITPSNQQTDTMVSINSLFLRQNFPYFRGGWAVLFN